MAWTATLREKRLEKGKWVFVVTYVNGGTTVIKDYTVDSISDDAVKAIARAECDRMTAAEAASCTIVAGGSIDLTPPTPPTPPTPTQAEINEAAWFAGFRELRQLRKLADTGLMSQSAAAITTLEATLRATYLPAYAAKVSA